jgi:hypothetical protein
MAGVRFVVGDAGDLVDLPVGDVGRVDVVQAGPRVVAGGRLVEGQRHVLLAELLDGLHVAVRLGKTPEEAGCGLPAPLDQFLGELNHGFARLRGVLPARVVLGDGLLGIRVSQPGGDLLSLLLDLVEVREAHLMDLLCVQRERGPAQDLRRVHPFPAREVAQADRLGSLLPIGPKDVQIRLICRPDGIREDAHDAILEVRGVLGDVRGGRRVLRVARQQPLDRADGSIHHQPREHLPCVRPSGGNVPDRIQIRRDRPKPGQVLLRSLGGVDALERAEVCQEVGGPPEMRYSLESVHPMLDGRQLAVGHSLQHVERSPRFGVERRPVQRPRLLERSPVDLFPSGQTGLAGVG